MVSRELAHEREEHPSAVFYTENTNIPGRELAPIGVLFQAKTEKAAPISEPFLWERFRVPRVLLHHDYFSRETGARYYFFKAPFELDVRGNIPQGLGDLQQGKDLAFDNSRLWLIAGLMEFNHGLTEQAERTFEKSTRLNPQDPLAWYNRGIVAEKLEHFGDSINYFKKMIPLAPQSAAAHLQLGRLYSKTGQGDEAVREWETTRQMDPLNGLAYRELGLYFQSRKPDYAAQMIRQYLELTPEAPDRGSLAKWLAAQPR
jgi:tetratricopeptide (TPR) repeat protein